MAKARILAVDDQLYFRVFLEDLLLAVRNFGVPLFAVAVPNGNQFFFDNVQHHLFVR